MDDFPELVKCRANKIATNSRAAPGVEGYMTKIDPHCSPFVVCRRPT
jgi:hypothetical protein